MAVPRCTNHARHPRLAQPPRSADNGWARELGSFVVPAKSETFLWRPILLRFAIGAKLVKNIFNRNVFGKTRKRKNTERKRGEKERKTLINEHGAIIATGRGMIDTLDQYRWNNPQLH